MVQRKREKLLPRFATFDAVYCSGFFIDNGALLTTLCLLFERVWLPNYVELVVEFSKKFRFHLQGLDTHDRFARYQSELSYPEGIDRFAGLTSVQRQTAMKYLDVMTSFSLRYSELFKEQVLCSDLFPNGKVLSVSDIKLVEKGPPGGKNKYAVSMKSVMQTVGGTNLVEELDGFVTRGAVPVLSAKIGELASNTSRLRPKILASLLAMKAIELTLPEMKAVHPDVILEARERLSDLLPLFWSAMLKLSIGFRERVEQGQSLSDVERECEDYVDLAIRPALIELNSKLKKDRKSWFHKILSAGAKETKLIIGKPPLTLGGLVSTGLQLGANIALDVAQSEFASQEAGLTYLIELNRLIEKGM